jgi:hypothetical protein
MANFMWQLSHKVPAVERAMHIAGDSPSPVVQLWYRLPTAALQHSVLHAACMQYRPAVGMQL